MKGFVCVLLGERGEKVLKKGERGGEKGLICFFI